MKYLGWIALSLFTLTNFAVASGFRCEEVTGKYEVLLLNHVDPIKGTRTPAKFVISSPEHKTLLLRRNKAIKKKNLVDSVQYRVEGNRKIGADHVGLYVDFKEGVDTLEKDEWVFGRLTFFRDDKQPLVYELDCFRHLKD